MVSFRFHLVSLVAVFLALGLGVLTGTTVLNRGIVTQLENNTNRLSDTSARLREQVRDLQAEVEMWDRFGTDVTGSLIDGRLLGRDAVLITQEGTDTLALDRVRRGLERGGAVLQAVLSVDARMIVPEEADVAELARLLDTAESDPEALVEAAAAALSARLVSGPSGTDLLDAMLAAGFLQNRGPGLGVAALREVGGPEQLVVVVAGGQTPPIVEPEQFLVPLVRELSADGALVGAGEGSDTGYPFVELLRSDPRVAGLIASQDNVDQLPGEVGFVLAVEDLVENRRPGHYGIKSGSDGLLPAVR